MTTITLSTLSALALDSQVVTSVDVDLSDYTKRTELSDYVERTELSDYVEKDRTDISSNMTLGAIFEKLATDLGHTWK